MKLKPIPPPRADLLFFPEKDTEYKIFEDAKEYPFDHAAVQFSPVNAWWLADAALLAYWDPGPAGAIWSRAGLRSEFFSKEGTGVQCYIGWTDRFAIATFRGTEADDWHDVWTILKVGRRKWPPGGTVHSGFLEAFDSVWPDVEKKLNDLITGNRTIWFTGHSMGAALATLAMDDFGKARGLYTIGSPPVGNRGFARHFNTRHAGRSFRYVNHHDIVVLSSAIAWLLGYHHVDKRIYIDAQGVISQRSLSMGERATLLRLRFASRRINRARELDPLIPLPDYLIDHTPRRYAVYVWNDLAARS